MGTVICENSNILTGKNSVGQYVHLNWEKCCVAVQTSVFGKNALWQYKYMNFGKILCGNTSTNSRIWEKTLCGNESFKLRKSALWQYEHLDWKRTVWIRKKVTVGQYKFLSTAKGSAWLYNCLKKGKLLCDRTRMRMLYDLPCVNISEEQVGFYVAMQIS